MMRPALLRLSLLQFALLMTAGCVGGDRTYPSLAARPIEQRGFSEPEAKPVAAAPADAALDARAASLQAQAQAGDAAFRSAGRTLCAALAGSAGAAEGSERWLRAQEARSALEAARAPTRNALADLDALLLDKARAGEGSAAVDIANLGAADARVTALDTAQQQAIAGWQAGGCGS